MKLTKQEELARKQAGQVKEMSQSEGWQQVLGPWLEVKRDQSFPDPTQFKIEKEFNYAAVTASMFKKVIIEILQFIEQQEQTLKTLNKKKYSKEDTKFKIGQ